MTNQKQKKSSLLPVILVFLGIAALGIGYMLAVASKKEAPAPYAPPSQSTLSPVVAKPPLAQDVLDKAAAQTVADRAARALPTTASDTPTPVVEANGRFLGSEEAPVKIIEFSSLTCSHCAHFHNAVLDAFRVKYVDTGLVQIEFRDFPLNKPALDAVKILRCLPEDQYFPFSSMLFQTQDHWAFTSDYMTPLRRNAKLAGLNDAQIDSCVNNPDIDKKIVESMQKDTQAYKIDATPTFIINEGADRISGALPLAEFSKKIDPLLPPVPIEETEKSKGNVKE